MAGQHDGLQLIERFGLWTGERKEGLKLSLHHLADLLSWLAALEQAKPISTSVQVWMHALQPSHNAHTHISLAGHWKFSSKHQAWLASIQKVVV